MAVLTMKCPKEVGVNGKAYLKFKVKESVLFEFMVCGDGMEVELYVNNELIDTIKVAEYIPTWGDEAEFKYVLKPEEEGEYEVEAILINAAGVIPGTCTGTDDDKCTIEAVVGGPDEAHPPGEEEKGIPLYIWAAVGIIGVAAVVKVLKGDRFKRMERLMELKMMKELTEE